MSEGMAESAKKTIGFWIDRDDGGRTEVSKERNAKSANELANIVMEYRNSLVSGPLINEGNCFSVCAYTNKQNITLCIGYDPHPPEHIPSNDKVRMCWKNSEGILQRTHFLTPAEAECLGIGFLNAGYMDEIREGLNTKERKIIKMWMNETIEENKK